MIMERIIGSFKIFIGITAIVLTLMNVIKNGPSTNSLELPGFYFGAVLTGYFRIYAIYSGILQILNKHPLKLLLNIWSVMNALFVLVCVYTLFTIPSFIIVIMMVLVIGLSMYEILWSKANREP